MRLSELLTRVRYYSVCSIGLGISSSHSHLIDRKLNDKGSQSSQPPEAPASLPTPHHALMPSRRASSFELQQFMQVRRCSFLQRIFRRKGAVEVVWLFLTYMPTHGNH